MIQVPRRVRFGLALMAVVISAGSCGVGGPSAIPSAHSDGAGALASVGRPVVEGNAVAPGSGTSSWSFGMQLCARDAAVPIVLRDVRPVTSIGSFRFLGAKVRTFTPTPLNTPISAAIEFPPTVPDELDPIAGRTIETPCERASDAPYTELLVGLGVATADGGGWQGVSIDYTAGGKDMTLGLEREFFICGPAVADRCSAPSAS